MEHIKDMLAKFENMEPGKSLCLTCGTEIHFAVNQFSRFCPSCGVLIKLTTMQVVKEPKPPSCFICDDKGFIISPVQVGMIVYDQIAKCYCDAGQKRQENIPLVTTVKSFPDLRHLSYKKQQEWFARSNKIRAIGLPKGG